MANEGNPSSLPAVSGVGGTVSNPGRLVEVQASGLVQESQILDAVTGAVLTIAAALSGNKTLTVRDLAGTIAYLSDLSSYQPIDGDLTAISALSTNGLAVRTALSTWEIRTLVSSSTSLTVANGDGVSGNPSLSLAGILQTLGQLSNAAGTLTNNGSGTLSWSAPATSFGWNRALMEYGAPVTAVRPKTWTAATLPISSGWNGIAGGFSNGKDRFVAVAGITATSAYSTNGGATWSSATMPSSQNWISVAFAQGTFVAIAQGSNAAAYSIDGGQTWTAATLPANTSWRQVCYGSGRWIAVADGGVTAYSTNGGVTWTAGGTSSVIGNQRGIAYGNGVFAIAWAGVGFSGIDRSTDGLVWTSVVNLGSENYALIAFGNSRFLIAADGGGSSSVFAYDGETYAQIVGTISTYGALAFANGLFIASDGGSFCRTSPDGVTWTICSMPSSQTWSGYAWSNGVFAAVSRAASSAAAYCGAQAIFTGDFSQIRNWNLPDRSDTVAGLGAQTFTGDQVINANLGIGVTPGSRLQIEGNANLLTPTIGGNRIATVAIIDTANAPGCGGVLEFGSQTGKTFSAIKGAIHDGTNNTVGDLNFYTRNAIADAAMALRMTIAKTGEVGIGAGVIAGNGLLQLPSGTTKASGIAYGDTFQFRQSSGNIYQTGPAGADIVYAVQRSTGEVGYWQAGSGSCTFGTYSSTWLVLVTGGTAAIIINPSQNVGIGAAPDAGQGLLQLPTSAGIPTSIKLGTGYLYQRSTFPSAVTWDAGSTTTAALFVEANANAVRGYMGISAVPKIYIGSQTNHAVDINTNNTTAITIDTAQGVTTTAANYLKTRSVVSAAGTTTLDATDATAILTGTTTQTFTLPAAAAGRRLFIKNRSTGALTVNRAGSDTIDGGTTLNVAAGTAKILIANGTDWCVWNA